MDMTQQRKSMNKTINQNTGRVIYRVFNIYKKKKPINSSFGPNGGRGILYNADFKNQT